LLRSLKEPFGKPQVDERLHRFHVLVSDQVEKLSNIDKVDKTSVKFFVSIKVPEWSKPMAVIKMRVTAHHLAIDTPYILFKVFRESRGFSKPILTRK
jgi:hypothetical protein